MRHAWMDHLTTAWEVDMETARGLRRRLLFGYSADEFNHVFYKRTPSKQFIHFGVLEVVPHMRFIPFIVSQISAHRRSCEKRRNKSQVNSSQAKIQFLPLLEAPTK